MKLVGTVPMKLVGTVPIETVGSDLTYFLPIYGDSPLSQIPNSPPPLGTVPSLRRSAVAAEFGPGFQFGAAMGANGFRRGRGRGRRCRHGRAATPAELGRRGQFRAATGARGFRGRRWRRSDGLAAVVAEGFSLGDGIAAVFAEFRHGAVLLSPSGPFSRRRRRWTSRSGCRPFCRRGTARPFRWCHRRFAEPPWGWAGA